MSLDIANFVNAVPNTKFKYQESTYIKHLRILFDAIGYQKLNGIKKFANCVGGLHEAFVTSIKLG